MKVITIESLYGLVLNPNKTNLKLLMRLERLCELDYDFIFINIDHIDVQNYIIENYYEETNVQA